MPRRCHVVVLVVAAISSVAIVPAAVDATPSVSHGPTAVCTDPIGEPDLDALPTTPLPGAGPDDRSMAAVGRAAGDALSGDRPATPSPADCEGQIRPGARMTSPSRCTMNWVFRDEAGALYIGTAGHCVDGGDGTVDVGRPVELAGIDGPIGTVAFGQFVRGRDVALVRIDADLHHLVDPTVCAWGGPVAPGSAGTGERLVVYGHGVAYDEDERSRRGRAVADNVSTLSFVGPTSGGDSGMPVMTADGEAVSILTQSEPVFPGARAEDPSVHVPGRGAPHDAPFLKCGARVPWILDEAEAALGVDLELVPGDEPPPDAPRIGPGARTAEPHLCTLAWVVLGDRATYVATAGHCVDRVGQPVSVRGGEAPIGEVAYVESIDAGDLALVRVDDEDRPSVDPAFPRVGGPRAVDAGEPGTVVLQHGHGRHYRTTPATQGRAGVLEEVRDRRFVLDGTAQPGDSGSPVMTRDGRAVGIVTECDRRVGPVTIGGPCPDPYRKLGTLLGPGLKRAEAALGVDLRLATAPSAVAAT